LVEKFTNRIRLASYPEKFIQISLYSFNISLQGNELFIQIFLQKVGSIKVNLQLSRVHTIIFHCIDGQKDIII